MTVTLPKAALSGTIPAVASKSMAHRLYLCAHLADTPTEILCATTSADIAATTACLAAMKRSEPVLPCGESGSTLRFLLPVAAALGLEAEFHMAGRLPDRPMEPLIQQLTAHGVTLSRPRREVLRISGRLTPGSFVLPGNVSSQFISGLLFALPLLDGESTLTVMGPMESAPYVSMTLDALSQFGVHPQSKDHGFTVSPAAYRSPGTVTVEGDWSNAAFPLCAGALSGPVTVTGLNPESLQGDREILHILSRFGANIQHNSTSVTVSRGHLTATDIDASNIPDLVPVLAIVAAAAEGTTRIFHAARLRLKESDRLQTVCAMLRALGADAEETPDGLLIRGGKPLSGGTVHTCGDHRIAMSAAVASALCDVTVEGAEAVNKSYPAFWEALGELTVAVPLRDRV